MWSHMYWWKGFLAGTQVLMAAQRQKRRKLHGVSYIIRVIFMPVLKSYVHLRVVVLVGQLVRHIVYYFSQFMRWELYYCT